MATNTYVALATQTLSTTATSVTFSSIPQGYTDLMFITNTFTSGTATFRGLTLQIGNGTVDTGINYSDTYLSGNGTAASSSGRSSAGYMEGPQDSSTTVPSTGIFNFMNYANTTTFKTTITRESRSNANVAARVNLWRSTSAINIITIYSPDLGSVLTPFAAGSTFSLYGIASAEVGAKATGGTVTSDANYYYHTFLGGGGGAGGYRNITGSSLSATGYAVTVGGGGAGGAADTSGSGNAGTKGSDSIFNSETSTGGGKGTNNYSAATANTGGSGGAAGLLDGTNSTGAGNTPSTSPSQGNNSGTTSSANRAAGGGGGAGAVGGNGSSSAAGAGGAGSNSLSTWATVTNTGVSGFYAGGGGGGSDDNGYPAVPAVQVEAVLVVEAMPQRAVLVQQTLVPVAVVQETLLETLT